MKKLFYIFVLVTLISCYENPSNNIEPPDPLIGEVTIQSSSDFYDMTNQFAEMLVYVNNKTNKNVYLTRSNMYSKMYSKIAKVKINDRWITDAQIDAKDTVIVLRPNEVIEEEYRAYFDGQWKMMYPIEYENGFKDTIESNIINVINSYEQFIEYDISQNQITGEILLRLKNNLSDPIIIHYARYSGCHSNICDYTYVDSSRMKWLYWDYENSKWSYQWKGSNVDCYNEGPYKSLARNEEFTTKLKEDFPEEGIIISKISFFFENNESEYKHLMKEFYYKRIE